MRSWPRTRLRTRRSARRFGRCPDRRGLGACLEMILLRSRATKHDNDLTFGRMRQRSFGRLGWQVSEIGYGMWGMAGWSGSDDAESGAALDRAIERGCNFFDTAYAYGDGRSERLLRGALQRHAG